MRLKFQSARRLSTQSLEQANKILNMETNSVKNAAVLQSSFLNSLDPQPSVEDLDVAFSVYNKVFELTRGVDRQACAKLSLLCLNGGHLDKALESWTRLYETLTERSTPQRISSILNRPEFEAASLAALATYFVAAKEGMSPDVASQLVPKTSLPANLNRLDQLGGIIDKENSKLANYGLAKLQENISKNFSSKEYIAKIEQANKGLLDQYWAQVMLAKDNNYKDISEVCYATFISRYADFQSTEKAFNLWQNMVRAAVKPTVSSWAALLKAALHISPGKPDFFDALWDRMLKHKIVPNANCYLAKLENLHQCDMDAEMMSEFANLRKMRSSREIKKPSKPNTTTERSDASDASALSDSYSELNTACYNLIIKVLCEKNKFNEALEILELAKKDNVELDADTYNPILSSSGRKLGVSREIESKLLSELSGSGIQPNARSYSWHLKRALSIGEPIGNLYKQITAAGLKPHESEEITEVLIIGFRNQGQYPDVIADFVANVVQNKLRLNPRVLNALVSYQLKQGNFSEASEYIEYFSGPRMRDYVSLMNKMIVESLAQDRCDIAVQCFNKLKTSANTSKGANATTCKVIIDLTSGSKFTTNPAAAGLLKDALSYLDKSHLPIDNALATLLLRPNVIGLVPHNVMQKMQTDVTHN
ncbi:hypothetical protein DASB73_002620 [Starmerella bacillaris]|uniref:Mitochondrial 15S rRNA processing factor CCM1 n=1 Tax=Starmerella bacillaris TaxID=1247836 RepID=A0AAV5RCU7_STABA|nr:hypothetical protein DASB73_002620 [Starmerella bacillaris]